MSKFVKELIIDHLKGRFDGVSDLLLVNLVGLDANKNSALRRELRDKNIQLMVVKNSLARRATEGTLLAPAFEGSKGTLGVVWGGTDIVALAKEIIRLSGEKKYAPFEPRGGVLSGSPLTADEVKKVSKWPSREEQLSLLMGQVLAPGANLVSQLTSAGGALASQIKQKGESDEAEGGEAAAADGEAPPAGDAAAGGGDAPPAGDAASAAAT
jgi:large subunit ribosomal protein L10